MELFIPKWIEVSLDDRKMMVAISEIVLVDAGNAESNGHFLLKNGTKIFFNDAYGKVLEGLAAK